MLQEHSPPSSIQDSSSEDFHHTLSDTLVGDAPASGAAVTAGQFRRVCLTGGPCGGKTTVQMTLAEVFEEMGWKVYRVHETATLLLSGGVIFSRLNAVQSKEFQFNLLKTMLQIEETYMALAREDAKSGFNSIVICDRGTMDPSAYMPRAEWLELLRELQLDERLIRDLRYDCVVNLTSTAYGAELHFGKTTNKIRSENLQLARHLDDLVKEAWTGHPMYDIIDNSTGFEEKQLRVIRTVLRRLDISQDPSLRLSPNPLPGTH